MNIQSENIPIQPPISFYSVSVRLLLYFRYVSFIRFNKLLYIGGLVHCVKVLNFVSWHLYTFILFIALEDPLQIFICHSIKLGTLCSI